jgi:hypothetical protein
MVDIVNLIAKITGKRQGVIRTLMLDNYLEVVFNVVASIE